MHANSPLTVRGRLILVERIALGRPVSHVAAEMGVARRTAGKWWHRWLEEGEAGLEDRSSRPVRCPHPTGARLERKILSLRKNRKLGPARISSIVGVPASTVHRVLCRHGVNRLAWMDRPSGQVIRRIHTDHPGELVHVDVKLGRIPPGGGWRVHGRGNVAQHKVGFDFVHSAIDAHSRLAFSEVLGDERGPTCESFWHRAQAFFEAHAIEVEAVLTDNARNYLGFDFTGALGSINTERFDRAGPRPTAR